MSPIIVCCGAKWWPACVCVRSARNALSSNNYSHPYLRNKSNLFQPHVTHRLNRCALLIYSFQFILEHAQMRWERVNNVSVAVCCLRSLKWKSSKQYHLVFHQFSSRSVCVCFLSWFGWLLLSLFIYLFDFKVVKNLRIGRLSYCLSIVRWINVGCHFMWLNTGNKRAGQSSAP